MCYGTSGNSFENVPTGAKSSFARVGFKFHHARAPLPAVHVAEDRRVRRADDAVAVSLSRDHEDGFTNAADPPWEWVQASIPVFTTVWMYASEFADERKIILGQAIEFVK